MSIERKINRNRLKNAQKNNKINILWREYQVNKYGISNWCRKFNDSKKTTNKANRVTPSTVFYI